MIVSSIVLFGNTVATAATWAAAGRPAAEGPQPVCTSLQLACLQLALCVAGVHVYEMIVSDG